jgi:hypothetical protein
LNDKLIREAGIERWVALGKKYPKPLPEELEPFYCYTHDGGHSLIIVLENEYKKGKPIKRYLIAAPVKAVLRAGWKIKGKYIWASIKYDHEIGLITEEEDSEYDKV